MGGFILLSSVRMAITGHYNAGVRWISSQGLQDGLGFLPIFVEIDVEAFGVVVEGGGHGSAEGQGEQGTEMGRIGEWW